MCTNYISIFQHGTNKKLDFPFSFERRQRRQQQQKSLYNSILVKSDRISKVCFYVEKFSKRLALWFICRCLAHTIQPQPYTIYTQTQRIRTIFFFPITNELRRKFLFVSSTGFAPFIYANAMTAIRFGGELMVDCLQNFRHPLPNIINNRLADSCLPACCRFNHFSFWHWSVLIYIKIIDIEITAANIYSA